jgi:hypothetical protein
VNRRRPGRVRLFQQSYPGLVEDQALVDVSGFTEHPAQRDPRRPGDLRTPSADVTVAPGEPDLADILVTDRFGILGCEASHGRVEVTV